MDIIEKLKKNTDIDPISSCWKYKGTNGDGYGQITINKVFHYVHVLSAKLHLGYFTESGLHVLHNCRNKSCWNPDHLYLGTNQSNIADKVSDGTNKGFKKKLKPFCCNGHAMTEANTIWRGDGKRTCRECNKKWCKDKYARSRNRVA